MRDDDDDAKQCSLSVRKSTRGESGSCNACSRDYYQIVYVIRMRTMELRVCRACRDTMIDYLSHAV